MQPKPDNFSRQFAESFQQQQVVDAYRHRAPYPPETFAILADLIKDEPRTLLDVGAGSGDIARQCVHFVERVDAVDFSQNMIERGKQLPDGNHPHLHWIYGKIEEVPLTPPYALITAGSSIHWTEWDVAFPRFHDLLTPQGVLALVHRRTLSMPWSEELSKLQARYSTRRGHRSTYVRKELEERGLFHTIGETETTPIDFHQSIEDFIEGLHSRSNFARERLGQQAAANFDQEARALLLRYHPHGSIPLQVIGTVAWGHPVKPGN